MKKLTRLMITGFFILMLILLVSYALFCVAPTHEMYVNSNDQAAQAQLPLCRNGTDANPTSPTTNNVAGNQMTVLRRPGGMMKAYFGAAV